jgi:hypothetical protein
LKWPSWSWSYGSWIYNYLCNQCLSPLTLWIRIPLRRGVLNTTLCDKVCQWLAAGRWFSPGILISSTNEIDRHDVTERLLRVALNTITQTYYISFWWWTYYYDLKFPQCSPFNPKWDQDISKYPTDHAYQACLHVLGHFWIINLNTNLFWSHDGWNMMADVHLAFKTRVNNSQRMN